MKCVSCSIEMAFSFNFWLFSMQQEITLMLHYTNNAMIHLKTVKELITQSRLQVKRNIFHEHDSNLMSKVLNLPVALFTKPLAL